MDLSAFDTAETANSGAVMELRDPAGAPALQDDGAPITITLLGEDSDTVVKLQNRQTNRALRAPGNQGISAEVSRANVIERLVAATVSWSGVVLDGEPLKCTPENAKTVYTRFGFIRDQAALFITERGNFLKASPTS